MNKGKAGAVAAAVLCIMAVLLEWLQWDIIVLIQENYNSLVSGLIAYGMIGIRLAALIAAVVLIFRCAVLKYNKLFIILPSAALLAAVLLQFVIPASDTYAKWEYAFNAEQRGEVVSMLTSGETEELARISESEYTLPLRLRRASHNDKAITEYDGSALKVLFHMHRGIKNAGVVYVSDGSGIKNGDFAIEYEEMMPVDANWYLVRY